MKVEDSAIQVRSEIPLSEETLPQDADSLRHSQELSGGREQPPTSVPGFRVLRCLGEGKFGSVWLAREQNTGKQVAIKFYTNRRGLDWSLLSREVEKLAALYTSRKIVGLLEVGWDHDPPFYVMEHLENGSLAAHLANGPLPSVEAVRIAKGILQALVHAHGSGVLHCDLKPANVLLDSEYEPRLCDFGQSRLTSEQTSALGTLFYMAPEQADLKAAPDARWDVYALGALLYHMLCGKPPHRTPEHERLIASAASLDEQLAIYRRIVRESPPPAAHRQVSGVDRRLADIVDRCLQTDPQKRFPNVQSVLDSLEARDRWRSRRPLIALGVFGPLLLLLAMAPLAWDAMQDAVESARHNLTTRALESDALSARILARSIERELQDRQGKLIEIAEEPELRRLVETTAQRPPSERSELLEYLHERKSRVDLQRMLLGRKVDTSWFLTDAEGFQRWREPFSEETFDARFSHRDYFHGRGTEFSPEDVPEEIQPIRNPYFSTVFRSDATHQYMIAISVPVWDVERTHVVGVLARTVHLGELLGEFEESIRGNSDDPVSRSIALIDARDWKLLAHPWMTTETLRELPEEAFEELRLSGPLVENLERLHDSRHPGLPSSPNDRFSDYRDPVRQFDPRRFGGKWLAAFAPIGDTGWLAVVQERQAEALRPVSEMEARLRNYGLIALLLFTGLIGASWYFVVRGMNERRMVTPLPAFRSNAEDLDR